LGCAAGHRCGQARDYFQVVQELIRKSGTISKVSSGDGRNLYLSQQPRSGTIRASNRISGHRPIHRVRREVMKIRNILAAAGLAVAALGAATSASAQTYNGGDRHYDRSYDHRSDRRYDRHEDRRYERTRSYGWDRHHRHCWVEWRHHHRVTVCR
jgi:hypothetical protein